MVIRAQGWQPDLQNSKKRAERSERLMYEQSHRDYLRSGYLHHRPSVMAVNHYRDNAITYKAQRDKNARELKLAERGNYWHADASAWCCCADAKYTKELADAKAEKWCLRDTLPPVVVGWWTSKQSVSQCVKPPPPPAWIMQPPPTGRHRWTGLFHPQREADHYAKTTGRNPEVY